MRLVTRSDFDGLACAALLEELGIVDDYLYCHPKDLQDGKIKVNSNDVIANMPYAEGCGLWFDHHSSELQRQQLAGKFKGACEMEPSAARVIYNYYSKETDKTAKLKKFEEMLTAVDKADSAKYTREDILDAQGWMLLAFLSDPRTGLGYTHTYRVSNFDLMKSIPGMLRTMTIDNILASPDMQDRVKAYREDNEKYKKFLKDVGRVEGNAIVLDLRGKKEVPNGNRFMEYVLFPDQNISVRLADGRKGEFIMISVGCSILNRTSKVDVGALMLKHGGGGHKKVGTCQIPPAKVDEVLKDILKTINEQ
ncbi:MAG: exopolyphosphatase [Nitrospirota bacterium]|nr:exopolyphosphatase [Nitrospirota bacterium]